MKDQELTDAIAKILPKNEEKLDKAVLCLSYLLDADAKTKAEVTKTEAENKMKPLQLPEEPKQLKLDGSPRPGTGPRIR